MLHLHFHGTRQEKNEVGNYVRNALKYYYY